MISRVAGNFLSSSQHHMYKDRKKMLFLFFKRFGYLCVPTSIFDSCYVDFSPNSARTPPHDCLSKRENKRIAVYSETGKERKRKRESEISKKGENGGGLRKARESGGREGCAFFALCISCARARKLFAKNFLQLFFLSREKCRVVNDDSQKKW